jgi:hypothetical protein
MQREKERRGREHFKEEVRRGKRDCVRSKERKGDRGSTRKLKVNEDGMLKRTQGSLLAYEGIDNIKRERERAKISQE